jgi:hypothetical protein
VVLPGELQQQARREQHEQHHRDHHRPPVRHLLLAVLPGRFRRR